MICYIPTKGRPQTKTYKIFEESGIDVLHFIEPSEMDFTDRVQKQKRRAKRQKNVLRVGSFCNFKKQDRQNRYKSRHKKNSRILQKNNQMKRVDLVQQAHSTKIGDICGHIEPNITEDSIFYFENEPIGFYIKDISKHSEKLAKLADLANKELRSKNVPKSEMKRSSGLHNSEKEVLQYSTILGSVPPKPHMRRPYPTISSVHSVPSAQTFIKAMLLLCKESEDLIKKITPNIYERQKSIIEANVDKKWRFGDLFTSSISNYNISAPFHRDAGNLEGCVNVIIAKKQNATGGNTTVPDYGATMDSCDNSMLVYPAWRNVHGVTPIVPTFEGGYRNSLVFYPLKAFKGL